MSRGYACSGASVITTMVQTEVTVRNGLMNAEHYIAGAGRSWLSRGGAYVVANIRYLLFSAGPYPYFWPKMFNLFLEKSWVEVSRGCIGL